MTANPPSCAPTKCPVKVWFARSTNESGEKKIVFQGTNGTSGAIYLFAGVFTGSIGHSMVMAYTTSVVPAAETFTFALDAPAKDLPYFVMWSFHCMGVVSRRWVRFQTACFMFFFARGMPRLAGRF